VSCVVLLLVIAVQPRCFVVPSDVVVVIVIKFVFISLAGAVQTVF